MFYRMAVTLLVAAAIMLGMAVTTARASTGRTWHTCTRFATYHAGIYYDHNDHFAGTPGSSCITVTGNGHRITIDRGYQPSGHSVVSYDSIQEGDYYYTRDPESGLPAQIGRPMPVLHVTASGGPGTYLYDADLWFSRSAVGPVHYVREMIICNRWQDYGTSRPGIQVRIGARRWYVNAWMTGSNGHRHLLIRFLARRQAARATLNLAAFIAIARRYRYISGSMFLASAGYGPEIWEGGDGLTYSQTATVPHLAMFRPRP